MELKFSQMSVDTSLAQEYLKKNEDLFELYNDYNGTIEKFKGKCYYDGKQFRKNVSVTKPEIKNVQEIRINMASKLKQNATLILQLEYYIRNIPIEDTNAQLNLLIQNLKSREVVEDTRYIYQIFNFNQILPSCDHIDLTFAGKDPLLKFGWMQSWINTAEGHSLKNLSRETSAISHLLGTLWYEAGLKTIEVWYIEETNVREHCTKHWPVRGLNSGTVAVVSEDADVDSAVDKFISVCKQAPWRLRRVLVQESVYQQFKDALRWKCGLKTSKPLTPSGLCAETLSYNDTTYLIDPVGVSEDEPSVTVEAFRTTKEIIDLVKQDKPRYLSLWTNDIAEINEFTRSTKAPVLWVNNVADFRGPAQVSNAVFDHDYSLFPYVTIEKTAKVSKLCDLSEAWLKLDLESRRDVLCGVLDKYILLDPTNKLYTELKNTLSYLTLNSFVGVGKDYVCTVVLEPVGIILIKDNDNIFTLKHFRLLLLGNALLVRFVDGREHRPDIAVLEQVDVPVVYLTDKDYDYGDFKVFKETEVPTARTRVTWTNSGTIFAN